MDDNRVLHLGDKSVILYNRKLKDYVVEPLERKLDEVLLEIGRLEDRVKSLEKKITIYSGHKKLNMV